MNPRPSPPDPDDIQQTSEQHTYQQQQYYYEQNEPPCSTCRYTGMTVCAGLSMYFLKLAMEETTMSSMAKTAGKNATKSNKVFFYGGAVVWAAAGVYRSMLD